VVILAKSKSRSARWSETAGNAREAYDLLAAALDELKGIQEEFADWQTNLPENLAGSALGEKLDAVVNIDFDVLGDVETALDEAEGAELPLGFGRD